MSADVTASPDAPTPSAVRPSMPVVDPLVGSELDLAVLILQTARRGFTTAEALAEAVFQAIAPSQYGEAFRQALIACCSRQVHGAIRKPYSTRRHSDPPAPPAPVTPPPPGPARKMDAARALSLLPARINEQVNVGSVRHPEMRPLGDCTADDLALAIENRRQTADAHLAIADWYGALLDEVCRTQATTVRSLLATRRSA